MVEVRDESSRHAAASRGVPCRCCSQCSVAKVAVAVGAAACGAARDRCRRVWGWGGAGARVGACGTPRAPHGLAGVSPCRLRVPFRPSYTFHHSRIPSIGPLLCE